MLTRQKRPFFGKVGKSRFSEILQPAKKKWRRSPRASKMVKIIAFQRSFPPKSFLHGFDAGRIFEPRPQDDHFWTRVKKGSKMMRKFEHTPKTALLQPRSSEDSREITRFQCAETKALVRFDRLTSFSHRFMQKKILKFVTEIWDFLKFPEKLD